MARARARTASRATRSARGRREFGLGLASSWKRANYAYPNGAGKDRGKRPSYPINPARVRAARSFAARRDTAGSLAGVDRALRRRYGSVANALAAARRAESSRRRGGSTTRRRATASTSRRSASPSRRSTSRRTPARSPRSARRR